MTPVRVGGSAGGGRFARVRGQQLGCPPVVAVVAGRQEAPQLVMEPGGAGLVTRSRSHCHLIVHVTSIGNRAQFFEADV